jgi:predicted ATP-grasp superfamily ATP-dependent carboligase
MLMGYRVSAVTQFDDVDFVSQIKIHLIVVDDQIENVDVGTIIENINDGTRNSTAVL